MDNIPFEQPTDSLQQVKKPFRGIGGMIEGVETTVQRKWLVQTGPQYYGCREGQNDIDIGVDDTAGLLWLPGRAEWRDLPTKWL